MPENQDNIAKGAFARHSEVIKKAFDHLLVDIARSAEILLDIAKNNRLLLTCGNGGSAADAQHLSGEWLCRYKNDRRPLRAVSLSTDTSTLTAISNDYSFSDVFSRQIEALGSRGDVLVAISTSGTSSNILKAIEQAKRQDLKVIALTSERGTGLKNMADVAILVPSNETARIQEVHELIIHIWCEFIDSKLND